MRNDSSHADSEGVKKNLSRSLYRAAFKKKRSQNLAVKIGAKPCMLPLHCFQLHCVRLKYKVDDLITTYSIHYYYFSVQHRMTLSKWHSTYSLICIKNVYCNFEVFF